METTKVSKNFSTTKYSDDALGNKAQHVITCMTGNSRYTTPDPTLAVLQPAQSAFVASVAKAIGGTKQDTADKNAKREALIALLQKEADYVQKTSAGDEVAILSSGFDVYKKPAPVEVPYPHPKTSK